MKIFVSKDNSWSKNLFKKIIQKDNFFVRATTLEELKYFLDIKYIYEEITHIFFFHFSEFIPDEIFTKYKCISFHTANLPNGRGGNPIQNQILDKVSSTFVNAIQTEKNLDAGPIYTRRQISLQGSLEDIWKTIADHTYDMIFDIIEKNPEPRDQMFFGTEKIKYKRLKGNDLPFELLFDTNEVYDYIRMRDAEGYNKSQIKLGKFVLEFSRAKIENGNVLADVKIREGNE